MLINYKQDLIKAEINKIKRGTNSVSAYLDKLIDAMPKENKGQYFVLGKTAYQEFKEENGNVDEYRGYKIKVQ